MRRSVLVFLVALSVIAFSISLALPAFDTNVKYMIERWVHEPSKSYRGFDVLILGWGSIFFGNISWLANVGYISALALVMQKAQAAIPISILAMLISLIPLSHPVIEKGENGYYFYISNLNLGYYFWLGAIALICVASLVQIYEIDRESYS